MLPAGTKADASNESPFLDFTKARTRVGIPKPYGVIGTPRKQASAIGRKAHASDRIEVSNKRVLTLAAKKNMRTRRMAQPWPLYSFNLFLCFF